METPQEREKRQVVNIIKIILIVTAVLFILLAAFFVFKVHSEGRMALREAKNIKLALITADIEMYGVGKTIYAPEHHNGLADGVAEKLERYAGTSEGVTLLSYNRTTREVAMFTYTTPHYLVRYEYDGVQENWTVDYMWRIFVY